MKITLKKLLEGKGLVILLLSEFKKNKRSKAVYLSGLLVILYLALTVYYTVNTVGLFDNFTYLYKFSLSYMNYLILPMILLSFTTTAFSNQEENYFLQNVCTFYVFRLYIC